jgi:hypothetical protein
MLPTIPEISSCPALEGWPVVPPPLSVFVLLLISAEYWWLPGRLVCCSTPSLSLYASPDLSWVLAGPLDSWLVCLSWLSVFADLRHVTERSALRARLLAPPLAVHHWAISFLPHPSVQNWEFWTQAQCSTPTSDVGVRLQFAIYTFQFCRGGVVFSLPRGCAGLFSRAGEG